MSMLPERLKTARKRMKLTQRELANKLSISQSTIALYETGDRNPDPDTIDKLANFFNVSSDWLLGRTDNPTPPTDQTAELLQATLSGDIGQVVEILDQLDAIYYEEDDKKYIVRGDRKDAIVNFIKNYLIPSMVENIDKERKDDKEDLR